MTTSSTFCRKAINLNFVHARIPLIKKDIKNTAMYSDVFPVIKNTYFNVHADGIFSELLHLVDTIPCSDNNLIALGVINQYNDSQSNISDIDN
jgi:hypothetical protein